MADRIPLEANGTTGCGGAPELLTYGEAARFLRISPEHLRRLKMLGRVPFHKPWSGRVLFVRSELEALVRNA